MISVFTQITDFFITGPACGPLGDLVWVIVDDPTCLLHIDRWIAWGPSDLARKGGGDDLESKTNKPHRPTSSFSIYVSPNKTDNFLPSCSVFLLLLSVTIWIDGLIPW